MPNEDPYAVPQVDRGDIPDCHAEFGKNPEGYDPEDHTCHGCPDKFTCVLPANRDEDIEVAGLFNKTMTYDEALVRMQHRSQLIKNKKTVPNDLLTKPSVGESKDQKGSESSGSGKAQQGADTSVTAGKGEDMSKKGDKKAAPKKKKAVAKSNNKNTPKAPPKPGAKEESKNGSEKKASSKKKAAVKKALPPKKKAMVKKKAAVKKAPPKKKSAAKKKKAPPKKKASPKKKKAAPKASGAKKKRAKKGTDSKPLPSPRAVTEEQMLKSMEKIRLGAVIDLEFGHQLVRKNRDSSESVVTLTKQGYEFNKKVYGSLSAAAMVAADSPFRSGNDFFNLKSSGCTEVRDKNGKVIASKNTS